MVVQASNNMTMMDIRKMTLPDGRVGKIIEYLSQSNEALLDIGWWESNQADGSHMVIEETTLPTVYNRDLNAGALPSKSTTAQRYEGCSLFTGWSQMDVDLVDKGGKGAAIRGRQVRRFAEAMGQACVNDIFHGNPSTNTKKMVGLFTRLNTIGEFCIDALGTTNLASISLTGWGEDGVHGFHPPGTSVGLQICNYGQETAQDVGGVEGTLMRVYRFETKWHAGLAVEDRRWNVRIANIDTVALKALTGTQAAGTLVTTAATAIIRLMAQAIAKVPKGRSGIRLTFNMPRAVYHGLRIMAMEKTGNVFSIQQGLDQFGTSVSWLAFEGIPIRCNDTMGINETRIL